MLEIRYKLFRGHRVVLVFCFVFKPARKAQHHQLSSHISQFASRVSFAWLFQCSPAAERGHPESPALCLPVWNQHLEVEKYKDTGGQHLLQPSCTAARLLPAYLCWRPVAVIWPQPWKQAGRLEFPPWQSALLWCHLTGILIKASEESWVQKSGPHHPPGTGTASRVTGFFHRGQQRDQDNTVGFHIVQTPWHWLSPSVDHQKSTSFSIQTSVFALNGTHVTPVWLGREDRAHSVPQALREPAELMAARPRSHSACARQQAELLPG